MKQIRRLMVANRSEIAIRVFRAATELGIRTIAVYAEHDRLSLHRFKADEAYQLDSASGPTAAYLDVGSILKIAREAKVDAIHPGYGFLSESPDFAEACETAGITFIGPSAASMRALGDKVSARQIAIGAEVPVIPATGVLTGDDAEITRWAAALGYPLMLKASWGGGGRGMRSIEGPDHLLNAVRSGRRESLAAFGRDEVYLEKLIRRARHVEVQLLGDKHGTLIHLFERDCSIQRRNQKVIERAPADYLGDDQRTAICDAAIRIGLATGYFGAGTVEFLLDDATGEFYFIEVNPRIQVEHTVTEMVTGVDIVKAQIGIAQGGRIGHEDETGVPDPAVIRLNGFALQCRITTEDPENAFVPDFGRITAYRGASGYGIRIDGGTAYSGAIVTRHYDPLLEKITAWAPKPTEVIARMVRALREYRIRGVTTNLTFLEKVLTHPDFLSGNYTTRFIDETPALLEPARRQDRASKILRYIADVTVNGHPDVLGRPRPAGLARPAHSPRVDSAMAAGSRQILERDGAAGLARWMREQQRVLLTDTTLRDAHQSLLATRLRTADMLPVIDTYASGLPGLFSLECWGGATFDVAMRFLQESPWERIAAIRQKAPNLLTQMLLRGANGVGYTNYPDNVVRHFIAQAARHIDIFRIFDCLNWVENMRIAIDAVNESGKVAEGAICYTGDILDPSRSKYDLKYYLGLAKELDQAGCHVLAIKDMAGLLKPAAARVLIRALRDVTDLPIHLHTHDTSGAAAATVLTAVEEGVDAIDVAIDSMSGTTSQPCLGAIVEALRHTERDTGLDMRVVRALSGYWESVRAQYSAFESDLRSGASEVYLHEMPGGQFTNLREQARSLGLASRWDEVARAYADANQLFGDIVKVTPSSKVVGDMALLMVAQNVSTQDVLDSDRVIAFPSSVVEMLRGDLGQPPGGWPSELQRRVLGAEEPIIVRPASLLAAVDLEKARVELASSLERAATEEDLASALMYPKVFAAFCEAQKRYGPVTALPTDTFFYGMEGGQEISVEIEPGKTLVVRLQTIGDLEDDGMVRLFFELNGQPRVIATADRRAMAGVFVRAKADPNDPGQIGAPMPGVVVLLAVSAGQQVRAGDVLLTLEAMKMETPIIATRDGSVETIAIKTGQFVDAKDLLLVIS